jgi:murein endopeptidase
MRKEEKCVAILLDMPEHGKINELAQIAAASRQSMRKVKKIFNKEAEREVAKSCINDSSHCVDDEEGKISFSISH